MSCHKSKKKKNIDNKARSPGDHHCSLETRLPLAFLPQCTVAAGWSGVGGGVYLSSCQSLHLIVQVATAQSAPDSLSLSKPGKKSSKEIENKEPILKVSESKKPNTIEKGGGQNSVQLRQGVMRKAAQ